MNRFLTRLLAAVAAVLALAPADAQTWPDRPLRIVVAAPAGSSLDALARVIGDRLKDRIGQPVIVENKPAAGGTVATGEVAKSAPDGYTMVLSFNGPLAFGPLLQKLPYDVQKDLAPVIITSSQPNVLAVNAQLPVKTVQELVAWSKANPGKLNYASVGNGSSSHLNMELLKSRFRARRRPRAVQRLAAGRHRHGPGRDADDVRRHAAAAGADPGRQAARDRGDHRQALPAAARSADDRRVRVSRLRGAGLERPAGGRGDAAPDRAPAQRRDQRHHEAAGRAEEDERSRLRPDRRHAPRTSAA